MASPKRIDGRPGGRFYKLEDGTELPSVTTILSVLAKPQLLAWMAKTEREMVSAAAADLYQDAPAEPKMSRMAFLSTLERRVGEELAGRKKMRAAADIGTEAHAMAEWELKKMMGWPVDEMPKLSQPAAICFAAWEEWRASVELEPLWIEQKVFSRAHLYAGTLDLIARVNGELTVVDFKTSKAVYPEAFLQIAAYAKAIGEMGHEEPKVGMILRLPKTEDDPGFEAVPVPCEEKKIPDLDSCFGSFLHVCEMWKWSEMWESKRREEWKNREKRK